ncbi:MAG: immunoglobulin domain-containing protein, partial [Chitinophagales bacterium]|nr:immunoglobulin domain-containing protein [Chitinophagales bacterium]
SAGLADSGYYYAVYSPKSPCAVVNSDTIQVNVTPQPRVSGLPTNLTVCEGSAANFIAGATEVTGYNWFKSGTNLTTNNVTSATLASASTNDLTFPATQLTDSGYYRVKLLSLSPCADSFLDSVKLTVQGKPRFLSTLVDTGACRRINY